jgi:hypothetical protein
MMNEEVREILGNKKNRGLIQSKIENILLPKFETYRTYKDEPLEEVDFATYLLGKNPCQFPNWNQPPTTSYVAMIEFKNHFRFPQLNHLRVSHIVKDSCYMDGFFGKKEMQYDKAERIVIATDYYEHLKADSEFNEVHNQHTWLERCQELNISGDVIEIVNTYMDLMKEWIDDSTMSLTLAKDEVIKGLTSLDQDSNGIPDSLEKFPDLMNLLEENQNKMMEPKHIQEIVRVILNLEKKCEILRNLFMEVRKLSNQEGLIISDLKDMYNNLNLGLTSYQMMMLSTISMINSSITNKTVQYYREYELLESLGLFQSSWEKEVGAKLGDIGEGLSQLIGSISRMEASIIASLESNANRIIGSVDELESSVNSSLASIDSSISLNTFVTGIQAYQTYKLNKKLGS